MSTDLVYTVNDFDIKSLSFPIEGKRWITFGSSHQMYSILLTYIAKHLVGDSAGYTVRINRKKSADDEPDDADDCPQEGCLKNDEHFLNLNDGRISVEIGTGHYLFRTLDNKVIHAVHNNIGKPVGTGCGPDRLKVLILFTEDSLEVLTGFLTQLLALTEFTEEGMFTCYTWHIQHSYWRIESRVKSRPINSVVLPNATKQRVIQDIDKFLSQKSRQFYTRNGIPYRRAYLFHGIPGTGKTSFVQALAGHFHRSVCYLLPSHPEMTDDSLRTSITSIPSNSIVVFEDIDALFTKDRVRKNDKSALTFSGLLNALDGIGNPNGQIFVLTTNLRDELDSALIRNGRVDMHVEFGYAMDEQLELIWRNFYPEVDTLAIPFAKKVRSLLNTEHLNVTMAELQHFFITQMDSTAEVALENVGLIIDEINFNSSQRMLAVASTKKPSKNRKNEKKTVNLEVSETLVSAHCSSEEVKLEIVDTENVIVTNKSTTKPSRRTRKNRGAFKTSTPSVELQE
jgi:hypothetical protein